MLLRRRELNRIGIFGTSGMAREAGDIARSLNQEPILISASRETLPNSGYEVICEEVLGSYTDINFVIGIADARTRRLIHQRYMHKLKFVNLIHPMASFGFGQKEIIKKSIGSIIAAGVRFTNNIAFGNFNIINQNATIAHDCVLENFVHVAPGVNLSGNVHLKDGCYLGAGSTVNQGSETKKIFIGENCIVGSGSVILSDCCDDCTYVGVPAVRIK